MESLSTLLFDQDGETLLSGDLSGDIRRWSLEEMKEVDIPVKGFGASISSIFAAQDGGVKALALQRSQVILLNVNHDPPLGERISAPDAHQSNVAFSPDGRLLASAGEFGNVEIWDVNSRKAESLEGHEKQVSSLAFAPDGKTLVSGSMEGEVIFWDVANRKALGNIQGPQRFSPVWSLASSPDGKTAAAAGDAKLSFFDLATRQPAGQPITSQKDRIWTVAYSPDGKFLASAGNNLQVAIWKAGEHPTQTKTIGTAISSKGTDFEVMPVGVAFSPDGKLIASGTQDHSVTLWDFKSGQPILPILFGHTGRVASAAFSPDGKILASGGADGDIRLWDVDTHELLGTFQTPRQEINSIVFSPDGGTLVSVGHDDVITFWTVEPDGWMKEACHVANRNLTQPEWNTYIGNRPYRKTCREP
jgi:WD40 repeat protein